MKSYILILTTILFALPTQIYADIFQRITTPDDVTEDGEYIIGALGYTNPRFFILKDYNKSKYSFSSINYSADIPRTIDTKDIPEARILRAVYDNDCIALDLDGQHITTNNQNRLIISTDAHTSWKITSTDGEFTLENNGRYFRLNSKIGANLESPSTFGIYAESIHENRIILYKRCQSEQNVRHYRRFIHSGVWETLCLPFTCSTPEGCKVYTISTADDGISLTYKEVSTILAGTAYVICSNKDLLFSVSAIDDSFSEIPREGLLTGTYTPIHINSMYALDGNNFIPMATECLVPAFRAYLKLSAK